MTEEKIPGKTPEPGSGRGKDSSVDGSAPTGTPSPHDQFFTYAFSDKENLRDLLNHYLPPAVKNHIDCKSLEVSKKSFIDEALKKSQSDLLVTAKTKDAKPVLIYILLEHKAYTDRWTIFQLLKYMVRIWEKHTVLGKKENSRLPVIIPIIFYHGKREWRYPISFEDLFEKDKPELTQYIPRFTADFIDAKGYEKGGPEEELLFQAAMTLFKFSFRGLEDHVGDILEVIARAPLDRRTKDFLSAIFRYILIAGRRENRDRIEQAIKEFRMKEVEEAYMTIADELMERGELRGIKKGIRKGKIEGKIEDKQQVLIRLLKRKFSLSREEEQKILSIHDAGVLDRALDEIITAESKEDVLGLLQ